MNAIQIEIPEALVEQIADRVLDRLGDQNGTADRWLRSAEAIAEHLNCSPSRVYSLVSARRIPIEHDGAQIVVKTSVLDRWIESGGASCPGGRP